MAKENHIRTCECCGNVFLSKLSKTRFCSKKCKDRQRYIAPAINCVCKGCNKHFKAKKKAYSTFCSSTCGNRFIAKIRREVFALTCIAKRTATMRCAAVLMEISALKRIKQKNEEIKNNIVGHSYIKQCDCCKKRFVFVQLKGCRPKYCEICRVVKNKLTKKKGHRISKAKRRAKERCIRADKIDPFDIFERDKWTCKICGCKTPKRQRGTYNSNAPELDHILPLSKGGEHKISNVQCACRKCNQIKGDKPLGQLNLGII